MTKKEYLSVPEFAKVLGISRIAVYKKIRKGQIEAIKIGRNYAIPMKYLTDITGTTLREREKQIIDKAVKKTFREYGEVLKLLGRE
jgi:excisionase family DNA binding protein